MKKSTPKKLAQDKKYTDAEVKKFIKMAAKEIGADIKRQMGAYKEEMHGYVKGVAEQHLDLDRKIDNVAYDVKEIKSKVSNIEFNMKIQFEGKADKRLFVDLDNRVSKLERKK